VEAVVSQASYLDHWLLQGRSEPLRAACMTLPRSKMAVSVFPGVRLLSIGDANGDIQRHSEQQPLRLEIKTNQDAALISLSNS